jgi:mono/diheme cytochrome c family protein
MTLCQRILSIAVFIFVVLALYLWGRFGGDRPVEYADPVDHFKYGSTGGERVSGFPYWIWRVLPEVCAHHLPGKGYESLGMLFEPGKDLPIGVSKRHVTGMDRVFLNCAGCHTGTVRETPASDAQVIVGMPAHQLDLLAFQNFFVNCAGDAKFSSEYLVPAMRAAGAPLDLLDRYLVYPIAIGLMRERLLMLSERFAFTERQPPWGNGRVDTWDFAKALFNFPFRSMPVDELQGASDFPSIWNQRPRQGMQLHWDGNNTMVEERNKSAAFGTGTTPPTIDLNLIKRVEDWLLDKKAPPYPFPIDRQLAARGAPIYKEYCADCHGASATDFSGEYVGKVTPIAQIGTDRKRLDSYTEVLAANQGQLYTGYPWRFTHFRKTYGYANAPLDGLWLRAPYLHNGSVPTLRDLLEPSAKRPRVFHRGYDVYDPRNVGFVTGVAEDKGRRFFKYDITVPGNGNAGHEGKRYGTELPPEDKQALVEFLKAF